MKTTNTFTPEKTPAQKWEEATLATNFIFCKIMESEPELCKHLLEILLHIEIDHLEPPQAKIETARILKHSGVDLSLIQKATGLTSDQINEL